MVSWILNEYKNVVAKGLYTISEQNYYEISTDKICIKDDNFKKTTAKFALLHELAHRYQCINKIRYKSLDDIETDANSLAFVALSHLVRLNRKKLFRILEKGRHNLPLSRKAYEMFI